MIQDFEDLVVLRVLVHKSIDCHINPWSHHTGAECIAFLDQKQKAYYLKLYSMQRLPLFHLQSQFSRRLACVEKTCTHQYRLVYPQPILLPVF